MPPAMKNEPIQRDTCAACERPRVVCLCPWLVTVEHRTPVVVLRHPNEARHALNTARLLQQMGSRVRVVDGEVFAPDEVLESGHRPALLFPGESARLLVEHVQSTQNAPNAEPKPPPLQLVVLDGTWSKARRIFALNPWLAELPQFRVELGPSRYILRKRAPEGGSTLEAVVAALGLLEGPAERFEPMLAALDQMMAFQREAMGEARFQQDFGERLPDVEP